MTWREEIVAKILLLVARMLCDDGGIEQEIKRLATSISTGVYDKRNREGGVPGGR